MRGCGRDKGGRVGVTETVLRGGGCVVLYHRWCRDPLGTGERERGPEGGKWRERDIAA